MNRIIVVYTLLAFLCSCLLENVAAQDSWNFIKSMTALEKVIENLQSKIELQAQLLNSLVTKAEMHEKFENLEAKVDELKTLLINSNVKEDEQMASFKKLEQQSDSQVTSLIKVEAKLENQTSALNTLVTREDMQSNKLTNIEANITTLLDGVTQSLRATKGIVEGIIAGTSKGVVVIPFDTREQRTISRTRTSGIAFNWQSRKVHWIEHPAGIKTANLDGSSSELLIADTSDLCGLAVDQITGNIYYGIRGISIRVCDSRGKKCATVASGVNNVGTNIWDIALFPTAGLMFWSNRAKKSVTRANMDGNNATVVILEHIFGLFSDEFAERLYWVNNNGRSIGHRNLDGNNRNVLLSTPNFPWDLAVDGDTLYYGGQIPNGVYSFKSDRKVSSIANTTGDVYHIDLYGSNKVPLRPNDCYNSPCPNLCVLTRVSYTCL